MAALALAACGADPEPEPPAPSSDAAVTTVATDLDVPWGVAMLPDGSALVAERPTGRVLQVRPGAAPRAVGTVPGVRAVGEGGLLGLVVDGSTLVAYLTTATDNRVVRLPLDGPATAPVLAPGTPRVLLAGIPAARVHNGGRLALGPDGLLYVGTGDAGEPERAQDRADLGGKVLRIGLDGSVPADNPYGSPVWSLGHRNVQGLAFDGAGRLWATEFGQSTYDEVNRIEPGGNYGWPAVEGPGTGGGAFRAPQVVWPTEEASPSGAVVAPDGDGEALYVAALRGQRLWVVPLDGAGGVGEARAALVGAYGRLRTVALAPDGALWVATSNRDGRGEVRPGDDRIVRYADPADALG